MLAVLDPRQLTIAKHINERFEARGFPQLSDFRNEHSSVPIASPVRF